MDAHSPNPGVWWWAGGGRGSGTAGAEITHGRAGRFGLTSDHDPTGVYRQFLPGHRLRKDPPLAERSMVGSTERGAVLAPSRRATEQPSRCNPRMPRAARSGPTLVDLSATHAPGACAAVPLAEEKIDVAVNGAVLARSQHAITDVPECRQTMEARPDRSDPRRGGSLTAQAPVLR